MTRDRVRGLAREPLLQFFALGAALFALYAWLHRGLPDSPNEILVSRGQVSSLQAQFERVWQRPASADEVRHLVDDWVREEIFYREGLAMGLDRDDPVVRRRVAQKIQFIVASVASTPPGTAELQTWLDAHPADYQVEPRYSLRQVYFDPERRGGRLRHDLADARLRLANGAALAGDSTLLPFEMRDASRTEVEQTFGAQFASALKDLSPGSWQGPLPSAFGLHLVLVVASSEAHAPLLEQVRAQVERDLLEARSLRDSQDIYDRLRANYRVRLEPAATAPGPAG